jgi:hypothetical protein
MAMAQKFLNAAAAPKNPEQGREKSHPASATNPKSFFSFHYPSITIMSEASLKRKTETTTTQIPSSLDDMDRSELVDLLCKVATERDGLKLQLDQLHQQQQKKQKLLQQTALAVSTAHTTTVAAVVAAPVTPTAAEVTAIRKRLGKMAVKAIKKGCHGGTKKPISEFSEGSVSSIMAKAMLQDLQSSLMSDTARMTKYKVTNDTTICEFLGTDRLVHPVKDDGKGYVCFGGPKPKIYAWAKYDSMEIKYDKRDQTLQLKIKTVYAGSGRPEHAGTLIAYSKGETDILREY